jgi:hypothetical protein
VAGGTNVLSTAGGNGWPGHLTGMSGDTLPAGFAPDYALIVSRSGAFYNDTKLVNLASLATPPVNITFAANFSIASNTFVGLNDNVDGVNDVSADDPVQQATNAATAANGVQLAIARTSLGSPGNGTQIKIYAVLVGGGGYWSNQVIPPLGGGVDNLGDGPVNQSGGTAATYAMSATPSAPSTYNGQNIHTAMSGGLAGTQNNYTQFGNQILAAGGGNDNCMQVALDRSNLGGVKGCSCPCIGGDVSEAGDVSTGYEFDIPAEDIGLTTPIGPGNLPTVRIMAVLTGNTGFMSNQFLPGIGSGSDQCNLGWPNDNNGLANPDNMANYPGDQFLSYTTQVPCSPVIGDVDSDGDKDLNDATTLVNVLLGTDTTPCHVQNANVNGSFDGANGRDIAAFIDALL